MQTLPNLRPKPYVCEKSLKSVIYRGSEELLEVLVVWFFFLFPLGYFLSGRVLEDFEREFLWIGKCVVVAGLTLLPLVVKVNPNFNVVATACLTVFIGCHRSVKPAPPTVSFGCDLSWDETAINLRGLGLSRTNDPITWSYHWLVSSLVGHLWGGGEELKVQFGF